jgi:aminoglycoside phosphotransferase (APT) family kinase protein
MIPEEKSTAVRGGLREAFGVGDYESIQSLTGGLSSAQAYKIVVKGNPYLLKLLRKEVISDPRNEFACMGAAAQAGIAPRIWYASVEERLLISDYVESRPFPPDMATRMAETIRRLHALPHFEKPKMGSYLSAMNGLTSRFQAARLLPESATEEVFRRFDEVVRVTPQDEAGMVSSHNDLKPQNIRFDGEQLWLVDWESAFLNNEYVDLAIAANFFVHDEAGEEEYLRAYFGEPAAEYRRARFYLMRQTLSMFYAALLLQEAARAGLRIDPDMTTPGFREYHQALIADKVDMMQAESKREYGMVHLREALRNMRTGRFEQAVRRMGEGNKT